MKTLPIPEKPLSILNRLESSGHEGYFAGGCVRDLLFGKTPADWDICTSAGPDEIKAAFDGCSIGEMGLKHGTVTIFMDKEAFEITTYRTESGYSDGRRPDSVEFVKNLEDDLARRDFTINAMAYHPERGLADPFGGAEDLRAGIIRCVGSPNARLGEDALRILRALRFAAVMGFKIDPETSRALDANSHRLIHISHERIHAELTKILLANKGPDVMEEHEAVIFSIIPELRPCKGFWQNNPYHYLTVWEHILESLRHCPQDEVLRYAMLFHDIAKPLCYEESDDGIGHFYGHPEKGAQIAEEIMIRLCFKKEYISKILQLIYYHDAPIQTTESGVLRSLNRLGEEGLRQMLFVKRADIMAQSENMRYRLETLDQLTAKLEEVLVQQKCFQLKDLAVKGHDLLKIGIPEGPAMGNALNLLLDLVISGRLENDSDCLLEYIKMLIEEL